MSQHRPGPPPGNRPAPPRSLAVERRWGQRCLAYFLCIRPDSQAIAGFAAIQDALAALERSLLRVPKEALHISVAWLLPVHKEYGEDKDVLWERHGADWQAAISGALTARPRFTLGFRELAATDTAVIAIASAPNPVTPLRQELAAGMGMAATLGTAQNLSTGELVHATLFRYGAPLEDPARLRERLDDLTAAVEVPVSEMCVARELVFPCLDYEIIHRFPLAPAPDRG